MTAENNTSKLKKAIADLAMLEEGIVFEVGLARLAKVLKIPRAKVEQEVQAVRLAEAERKAKKKSANPSRYVAGQPKPGQKLFEAERSALLHQFRLHLHELGADRTFEEYCNLVQFVGGQALSIKPGYLVQKLILSLRELAWDELKDVLDHRRMIRPSAALDERKGTQNAGRCLRIIADISLLLGTPPWTDHPVRSGRIRRRPNHARRDGETPCGGLRQL
jgi:hypothetical protein